MELSRQEANHTLQEVEAISSGVKAKIAYSVVGPILGLWGTVWIVCFLVTQFAPQVSAVTWLVGNVLGIGGTTYLGWFRPETKRVRSESAKRVGWRLFWFWFLLFVYGDIWLVILWPWRGEQLGMFGVTLVMFAYVVMGLWLEMRFMLWIGLAVTAIAGAGFFLSFWVPGYLNLWLGLAGGLSLLASSLYLMWRWR